MSELLIHDFPFHVDRPWGKFLQFTKNEPTTIKLLQLDKGKSISYQYHNNREEFWYLLSGRCWFKNGQVSGLLMPGEDVTIPKLSRHKLEGLEDSIILEISKGLFDEHDIVRL